MRKFEVVSRCKDQMITLPRRSTTGSAGYDFFAAHDAIIMPGQTMIIQTGVKAYMNPGEVLLLFLRSSSGIKRGMRLANEVGVIDSDYADNPTNEGEIGIPIWNPGRTAIEIKKGEKIAQGIFVPFLLTDDDNATGERVGGVGSTGV